jgi:hypothetical protein
VEGETDEGERRRREERVFDLLFFLRMAIDSPVASVIPLATFLSFPLFFNPDLKTKTKTQK